MATFFQFQRVRVVRCPIPEVNGMECTLMCRGDVVVTLGGRWLPGWGTDHRHPLSPVHELGVVEDWIEPLKHEPDAIDLMTQENAPSFDCPLPALSMLGEGG